MPGSRRRGHPHGPAFGNIPERRVRVMSGAGAYRQATMPDLTFEHPRLAAIYDAFDADRRDLDGYLAISPGVGCTQRAGCGLRNGDVRGPTSAGGVRGDGGRSRGSVDRRLAAVGFRDGVRVQAAANGSITQAAQSSRRTPDRFASPPGPGAEEACYDPRSFLARLS